MEESLGVGKKNHGTDPKKLDLGLICRYRNQVVVVH